MSSAGRYRVVHEGPERLVIGARRSRIALWVTVLVLVQLLVMAWFLTPASRFACARGGDCEMARWNFAPLFVHRETFPARELRGAKLAADTKPSAKDADADDDDAAEDAIELDRAGKTVLLESNLDHDGKQAWVDQIAKFAAGQTASVEIEHGSGTTALVFVAIVIAAVTFLATRGRWRLAIDRTAGTLAIANGVTKHAKESIALADLARAEVATSRAPDGETLTRVQLAFRDEVREVVPLTDASSDGRADHEALAALVNRGLRA